MAQALIGKLSWMSSRRTVVAGCVLAFFAAITFAGYGFWYDFLRVDPFDRFELLRISSDPRAQRHAATYRYSHANSSATVAAIWILSEAPSPGSKEPVSGSPALVWRGNPDVLHVTFQDASQRFLVEVKGPVDIRRDDAGLADCYFLDPAPPNSICLQANQIDLRVTD